MNPAKIVFDNAESIAVAVLQQLCKQGDIKERVVTQAMEKYRIDDVSAAGFK